MACRERSGQHSRLLARVTAGRRDIEILVPHAAFAKVTEVEPALNQLPIDEAERGGGHAIVFGAEVGLLAKWVEPEAVILQSRNPHFLQAGNPMRRENEEPV